MRYEIFGWSRDTEPAQFLNILSRRIPTRVAVAVGEEGEVPAPGQSPPREMIPLRQEGQLCDNYAMRSTRDVVALEEDERTGQYSDPPLLVLASLANGPKHGHAMIEDIARLCGTRLGPGTLYGAISRLERQGWIEPLAPEERRQPYRITSEGLHVLRAKLTTLQRFAKAGLRRLETL
jgi:DNA-binding PadR family transcriptional regulator